MPNQHSSSSSSTHDHSPSKPFTLGSLISDALGFWLIAWLLGILTALSVICLLMVSGWFVTLSAWAGLTAMGFNYLAPSALIRTFAITRTAGRYGELMTAHQAVFGVLKSLRLRFFAQFARLTPSLRKRLDSSDSQYRMVKDIDILDEFVLKFMSPLIISLAALLVVLGMISVMISAWFWLAFVVAFAIFALAVCQGIPLAKDERDLLWRRKQHFAHGLPAITQLILWGRWHGWLDSFSAHDRAVNRFFIDSHRLKHRYLVGMQWLVGVVVIALLWKALSNPDGLSLIASTSQATGAISDTSASAVALLLALVLGIFGLGEILSMLVAEPLALGRAQTAKSHLNALITHTNPPAKVRLPPRFDLVLDRIVTRQPEALFDLPAVTAVIRTGTPLVIKGISGAGKSTLLDTIAKELPIQSGTITVQSMTDTERRIIDWHDIDETGQIGYLGQQIDIFDQSLRDNLRLGKPDASDDELLAVLDAVGLGEWVTREPLGLDTPLGEYGTAVSGGQARRIALARLLLSPKKILLLDEPFAGLDQPTRRALWQTLNAHQQDGILVVVSHHPLEGEFDTLVISDDEKLQKRLD